MGGAVGAQPPCGLLELALAADQVPATRLVPGDGNVDEPLVEVPLVRLGGAPDVLEHLVRGEVLARADQLEAVLELESSDTGRP